MTKRKEYRPSEGHKAKKIRLDDDLSELEGLTEFPHVFGSIIDYLGKKDILALTETSKTLNLFIANSSKALNKFTMKFPRIEGLKNGNYDFQVIRKYSSWELSYGICDEDLEVAVKFWTRYREHIKSFSIYNDNMRFPIEDDESNSEENEASHISRQMLQKLLPICKNIRRLGIIDLKMDFFDDSGDISALDLPNLRDLTLLNGEMLPLFTNCHLKTLEIMKKDPSIIKDFLMKQNDLEALSISNAAHVFDTDQLTKVNFKLKRFDVGNALADLSTLPFLKQFLKLHRDTLTELELSYNHWNDNIFEGVAHRIQKLIVNGHSLHVILFGISLMTKITILSDIVTKFENVTEVHLISFSIDHDFLATLPNVKKLLLKYCHLTSALTCSNLTSLELESIHLIEDTFTWNENNLKMLIIKKCCAIYPFIEEFLQRDDTNLNRLELIGKAFMPDENPELHEVIDENRQKIRDLIIAEEETT